MAHKRSREEVEENEEIAMWNVKWRRHTICVEMKKGKQAQFYPIWFHSTHWEASGPVFPADLLSQHERDR